MLQVQQLNLYYKLFEIVKKSNKVRQQIMMNEQHWIVQKEPVWVHKNQSFHKAIIKQIYKQIITCLLENGDIIQIKKHDLFHRSPMPPDTSRTDLMQTDMMNEAEILQALKLRFEEGKIYTFVESTMIAVNPYQLIPHFYQQQTRQYYIDKLILSTNSNVKQLQPHIYSITAAMISAIQTQKTNQAIVISGQSGAGKTQANKQCLRFLGSYFNSLQLENAQSKIQQAIILSNPILQAFGNSKTIRNNNSSRFGKYLAIFVNDRNEIKHAQIYNYLLEKSRIISRSSEEQNFHIFYEFLTKTTKAQKIKYGLLDSNSNKQLTFQNFKYTQNDKLSQYHEHPQVSYEKVKQSLIILPNNQSYDYMCRILSAVLHLGNLEPYEDENEERCDILPEQQFKTVCDLLQVDSNYLIDALTSYSIKIGGQDLIKSFSKRQVQELIHSLSKTLYQRLFQWIINEINQSTASHNQKQKLLSMGFLDIYGFEVLKINSLEQLFINYTNERLHQIYLQKIFKIEKEHFQKEKLIEYFRTIQFEDNIKVIELMDFDRLSIFNLLDEWCSVASPDESTFITKIRFNHKKHDKFPPSNLNLLSTQFMIRHTPQDVEYNVLGFREKNKDLLREQIKITMRSSKLNILKEMFTEPKVDGDSDPTAHRVRKFLSSKFRKQMNALMDDILSKCDLHFIRCIKSNSTKQPLKMQEQVVYSQIKYLGILDTIKIKKMGYSIKVKYEDLDKRFYWLVRRNILEPAFSNEIKKSISDFLPRFKEDQMLFGVTRVFFRDFAYSILIKKYSNMMQYLNQRAHKMTSLFVFNSYYKKKQRKKMKIMAIKNYMRGFIEIKSYKKKIKRIISVQRVIRKYLFQKASQKKAQSIQTLQAYIKRTLQVRHRLYQMQSLQKIIFFFKRLVIRRRARKKLTINHFLNKVLFQNIWKNIHNRYATTANKYLNTLKVQIQEKSKIRQAIVNQRDQRKDKSNRDIQKYIVSFSNVLFHQKYVNTVVKGQNLIRTWIIRKRFLRLKKSTIVIQRAWRDYLFKKFGAKSMFNQLYKFYHEQVAHQNLACQSQLYDTQTHSADQLNLAIQQYLGKFRQKFSLLYWAIDFEAFVDLSIVYPNNSWIWNYTQVYKQSLQRQNPIQYLEVGETFTVASNTNKLYMWGMNEKYSLSTEGVIQNKSSNPVQYFQIIKNDLALHYHSHEKKHFKISSTVSKDYNLENGKLYECLPNELKLINILNNNNQERVVQMSCGKSHTILRTFSKRVYTFGTGREGQLGHESLTSEQKPRLVKYFETIKTAYPIQVSAGFNCSVVLLSNHKVYWFGSNSTISKLSVPQLVNIKNKSQIFGNLNQFCPIRIISSWSRTMSVIGLTILCYNGKMQNNIALKNKITGVLIQKWQEVGLQHINPPLSSISDHFEHCHVKLPKVKVNIQPESTKIFKEMEERIKPITDNKMAEFSFANTQRSIIFK